MLKTWDERRDYFIGATTEESVAFAAQHWIHSAQRAIQQRGQFTVALSGGSTPKAIYEKLALSKEIDWGKVWLFWSDERSVPPDHPDSNYKMAMHALGKLPIPPNQIFRMQAESQPEKMAADYEEKIHRYLGKHLFDLVMLGVGEDGHTASLFPGTKALDVENRLVAANPIPEKKTVRMTLTFPCINQSSHTAIYALGPSKQLILPKVLDASIISPFPSRRIGTPEHKALWVLDKEASKYLELNNP